MKLVLMERGLWRFIEGTEVAPVSGTATAAAINAYRLRSDKAYSLIALSVEKNLQVHISTTTDPKTAWETLKNQFECISIAQVVRLNRRFYAATMDEGTDILEHLTAFNIHDNISRTAKGNEGRNFRQKVRDCCAWQSTTIL